MTRPGLGSFVAAAARLGLLLLLLLGLGLVSCGASGEPSRSALHATSGGAPTEPEAGEVEVRGTALDARTGEVLAGVRIEGPRGTRAVSDRRGRFELHGLHVGDSGEVRGALQDGRACRVQLQRLTRARIELVLRLKRPE